MVLASWSYGGPNTNPARIFLQLPAPDFAGCQTLTIKGEIDMRPHERLDVWRKAIDLVVSIYEVTNEFPDRERYGLTSQIRRASVSISANIAEGAARTSKMEFLHYLSSAQGSASEVSTEILIAKRIGILADNVHQQLDRQLNDLGKMISGLKKYLKNQIERR